VSYFGAAFLAMFILYLPWLPVVLGLGKRESFWIKKPESNFFVNYFSDYFGNDTLSVYLFAFLLIVFLLGSVSAFRPKENQEKKEQDSYIFPFVVLITWISVSYLVPYVRSLTSLPLLVNRYTIVALPAILVCAAIAVEFVSHRSIKIYIVALAVLLSLINLFANKYYETPTRAQWREMSAFVVANNPQDDPIVTDRAWHLAYYFSRAKYKPHYLSQASLGKLASFWVVTGNNGKPISDQNRAFLQRYFRMMKSFQGISTSAQLFSRQRLALNPQGGSLLSDGQRVLLSDDSLRTEPMELGPGNYKLAIYGYGTSIDNEYPKLRISINDKVLNEFYITDRKDYLFHFQLMEKTQMVFSIDFLNKDASGAQDRKAFVQFVDVQQFSK